MWTFLTGACIILAVAGAAVIETTTSNPYDRDVLDVEVEVVPLDSEETESADAFSSSNQPVMCYVADGVMPEWRDPTCAKYYRCENYALSVLTCPDGTSYSLIQGTCLDSSEVDCEDQNEAVRLAMEGPTYLTDSSISLDGTQGQSLVDLSAVSSILSGLAKPRSGRSKRSILKKIGAAIPQSVEEEIEVSLPDSVCDAINHDTAVFESMMNALLITEARCSSLHCGLPLFSISCKHENENETDDAEYIHEKKKEEEEEEEEKEEGAGDDAVDETTTTAAP